MTHGIIRVTICAAQETPIWSGWCGTRRFCIFAEGKSPGKSITDIALAFCTGIICSLRSGICRQNTADRLLRQTERGCTIELRAKKYEKRITDDRSALGFRFGSKALPNLRFVLTLSIRQKLFGKNAQTIDFNTTVCYNQYKSIIICTEWKQRGAGMRSLISDGASFRRCVAVDAAAKNEWNIRDRTNMCNIQFLIRRSAMFSVICISLRRLREVFFWRFQACESIIHNDLYAFLFFAVLSMRISFQKAIITAQRFKK